MTVRNPFKDPLSHKEIENLFRIVDDWKDDQKKSASKVLPFITKGVRLVFRPKNTGKRYYHRCMVISHINPNTECVFVFSSEEKARAWKKATEASLTMPEVILDKIERSGKDGWFQ